MSRGDDRESQNRIASFSSLPLNVPLCLVTLSNRESVSVHQLGGYERGRNTPPPPTTAGLYEKANLIKICTAFMPLIEAVN